MYPKVVKVLCFFLCTILVASMVSCSPSSTSTTSQANEVTANKTVAQDSASKTLDPFGKYDTKVVLSTVRVVDSFVTSAFNENNPSLTDNVWAKAYKDKLNIEFNYLWTPSSEEYATKWNTAIASNDIPDCAVVYSNIYKQLLDAGLVENMTQYYNDYASDMYKKGNTDDGNLTLAYMTLDGILYGLPHLGTQPDNVNFLNIRKDWLDKVGKSEPKTIDELIAVAQAFVDAKLGGADTYGFCFCKSFLAGIHDMGGFLNGFGAYYDMWIKDSSSDTLVYSSIQPKMREALLKLQKMYKTGLINKDFAVKDSDTAGQDVVSGKVGIAYGIFWSPLNSVMGNLEDDKSAKWEVIVPPTSDGSAYISQATAFPGSYIFVKKGCSNPEAVVKVVNLNLKLDSEDYDTYNVQKNDDGSTCDVFNFRFASGLWMPWKNLAQYETVVNTLKSGDSSSLKGAVLEAYNSSAAAQSGKGTPRDIAFDLVFGPKSAFSIVRELKDSDRILVSSYKAIPTETMSTLGTTIKEVFDAAMFKVVMGDDISTFDKAVEAWKIGGGDKLTNEVNEWYKSAK